MRGLQLTILLSIAVVLVAVGGWGLWHTWQEQELPQEPASQRPQPSIAVRLRRAPLRPEQPANLDPQLRGGVWQTYLGRPQNGAGRAGALRALRAQLERSLSVAGQLPEDRSLHGLIRAESGVDAAAIVAVQDVLRDLGVTDIVVCQP